LNLNRLLCFRDIMALDSMLIRSEQTRRTFRKLSRQASEVAEKPTSENIHKFRAASRRVEVLVADLAVKRTSNDKKLLKMLRGLRKKAGRVRDLDVQSSALRSLKISQEPGRKSQLMRTLAEDRAKREKRLTKGLNKKTVAEVQKRLKRSAGSLEIPKSTDPLRLARQKLAELEIYEGVITESTLHQFRIAGKRARYIAELAGKNEGARRLLGLLKHMQDVIGDWHDWLQLAERAEKMFGGVQESPIVAALHNITRAKFRQSVNALTEIRIALAGKKPVSISVGREPSTTAVA
jgi:CHAD domain-containing protein